MRYLLAFFTSMVLAGCATSPVALPVDNLGASTQTPVEDLRPQNEGTREIFSLSFTNEKYGYSRLAQDLTDPTGPRLFSHRLQEKYGKGAVPPTKLLHFVVYWNTQAELRRAARIAAYAAFGSVPGDSIGNGTITRENEVVHTLVNADDFASFAGENEYKRATYTDSELTAGTSAFVIFIETESQDRRRFTRTVSPIKPAQAGQKIPLHQALDAAIQFHLNS